MKREDIVERILTAQGILDEVIPPDDLMAPGELKQQHMVQRMLLLQQIMGLLDPPERAGALMPRGLSADQEVRVAHIAAAMRVEPQEVREMIFEVGLLALSGDGVAEKLQAMETLHPILAPLKALIVKRGP